MELWIRSQDKKTLLKCDNITITIDSEDGKNIKGYKVVGYEDLGRYETEKRAIEILDEIQNILSPKYILDSSNIKPIGDPYYVENGVIFQRYSANGTIQEVSTVVYKMPEK